MSLAPKSTYDLVVLPGDGIGVEVAAHARRLLDVITQTTGIGFAVDEIPCGGKFYRSEERRVGKEC